MEALKGLSVRGDRSRKEGVFRGKENRIMDPVFVFLWPAVSNTA
jgi:hypothetical protein